MYHIIYYIGMLEITYLHTPSSAAVYSHTIKSL